jgi:hypothetical protein
VGGQKKTYEYNQYLVPLKRSDKLDCSMDVFIIPQNDLDDLIDEKGELKDISGQADNYKRNLAEYEAELAELEWKHSQLSKSYKELFKKQNKTRKKNQELEHKVEILESDREKLMAALKKVKDAKDSNEGLKTVPQGALNEKIPEQSIGQGKLNEDKVENTVLKEPKTEISQDNGDIKAKEDKEDKDIWTVLRSRLTKKEEEEEK